MQKQSKAGARFAARPFLNGRGVAAAFVMFLLCMLSGCASTPVRRNDVLMGTFISQTAYGVKAEHAVNEAAAEISRLEGLFSIHMESSEISRLNQNAGNGSFVPLSQDTANILLLSWERYQASGGLFDVTTGALTKLWGIGTENARVPLEQEITNTRSLTSMDFLEFSADKTAARLIKQGVQLDLGAVAKGYAADRCAQIYRQNQVRGVISVGGNTYAIGGKSGKEPFKIGIRNPRGTDEEIIGYIQAKDISVVTSGDYERYFEQGGVRYHHILDTRTGCPAQSGLMSVTVIGENSALCDALSTELFVAGVSAGEQIIEQYPEYGAVFVTQEQEIIATPKAKELFVFDDKSGVYRYAEEE